MKKLNLVKSRLSVGYVNNVDTLVKYWEDNDVFNKVNKSFSRKPFVLLDGPPYANGDAHMGHSLNKSLKDLVLKSRWFMGQPVFYQPGWDCHGLPLELAVEKAKGYLNEVDLKKSCKLLAFRSLVKQRKVFKKLGVLCNWRKPYVTLSNDMVNSSWKTVYNLVNKDLLFYKQYPVHYCPVCASSLAEAELEQKSLRKDSLFLKFKLNNFKYDNAFVVVWTTTPWTLAMNQGVAYNNDFEYLLYFNGDDYLLTQECNELNSYLSDNNYVLFEKLSGNELNELHYESPLTKQENRFYHGKFVESGRTGFVHLAFAHGPEDFELGNENNLLPLHYLNKNGVFNTKDNDNLLFLDGYKFSNCADLVVEKLKNFVVKHSYDMVEQNVCWRHKSQVYYNATHQVFLDLEKESYHLKNKVKEKLLSSDLSDKHKLRLSEMLLNRKNWCLSRQRRWGCKLNLVVDNQNNVVKEMTLNYVKSCYEENKEEQARLLALVDKYNYKVVEDVLDVWFDSGNVVNNYYDNNGRNNENNVVDLVLEGKDQFRGWFQSLLWLSVANNDVMPYKNLYCHGFVLDEKRKKLSKSSNNYQSVDNYLETYGPDVLRLWSASQESELDAVFSNSKLEEMKKYYSRIRLTLRFLTSNLYDYNYLNHKNNFELYKDLPCYDVDRTIMVEVLNIRKKMVNFFNCYDFKNGLELLYLFCEKVLSNFYFDYLKNPLYLYDNKEKYQLYLYELLLALLDMVKVYCPFVAEEFYQDFYQNNKSVFEEYYFKDEKIEQLSKLVVNFNWNYLKDVKRELQVVLDSLQKNKIFKSKLELSLSFSLNNNYYNSFKELNDNYLLSDFFGVSEVHFILDSDLDDKKFLINYNVLSSDDKYAKCKRCWSYKNKFNYLNDCCPNCY